MALNLPLRNILTEPGIPHSYDVVVYVKDGKYIAKDRNGTVLCTDSPTACIQEAVDAIKSQGIVYIKSGIYELSNIVKIRGGIVIRGSGQQNTIIRQKSGYNGALIRWDDPNASNEKYVISDIWFYGNNPVTNANALVDLAQPNGSKLGLIKNVTVECNPQNTVCIDLSGNEDTAVIASAFNVNTTSDRPAVKWFAPYGNITSLFNKYFGGGYFKAQMGNFVGDVFAPNQGMSLIDIPDYPAIYMLKGCYINGRTNFSRIFTFPDNGYGSIIIDIDSLFAPDALTPFILNPTPNPITVYAHIKHSVIAPYTPGDLFGPGITGYYALYGYIHMPNMALNGTPIQSQYQLI